MNEQKTDASCVESQHSKALRFITAGQEEWVELKILSPGRQRMVYWCISDVINESN